MKQCSNYEEAMHYDCACCDEDCEFRKGEGGGWAFICVIIVGLIFASLVFNYLFGS